MNREQKIALILGFAVILVVGVLVSDHWSRARELELADAAEEDPGVVRESLAVMLPGPGDTGLPAARPSQGPADPPPESTPDPAPVELAQRESDPPASATLPGFTPVDPSVYEPLVIAQGAQDGASVLERAMDGPGGRAEARNTGGEGFLDGLSELLGNGLREAARVDAQSQRDDAPSAAAEPQAQRASPAQPVRHRVAKDESLYTIAKRYYGDGNKWRLIAQANPGKVTDDGGVRAGVTLTVPDAKAPAIDAPASAPARRSAPERATPPGPTQYTVKKNDSLSEIAQRLLGSSKRMGEIIAANRGRISDPDDIRVGMVLTIPARS